MSGSSDDLYAVLGIARDATPAAVKAAYFRLARVHTPEDAPERFREISKAYEVLSDPENRRRYDAEERLPPVVAVALQRAGEIAESKPDEAVAAAKSVLGAHGASQLVRFCVAQACLRAKRPKEAIPLAEQLTRDDPVRADYAHFLGDAYLAADRLDDADRALKAALALDADRLGVYLSLANTHDARSRPDDALLVLDRGLRLDDGATMRLLPLRIRKLAILGQDGRWDEMERVVTSIQSAVPAGDKDAAQHVSVQLSQLAQQYDGARVYDMAKFLIDAALKLTFHQGLSERSREIAPVAAAQREARVAFRDEAVAEWIKALVGGELGTPMSDEQWNKLCDNLVKAMIGDIARTDREWKVFRGLYPRVGEHCSELFVKLREAAVRARSGSRKAGRSAERPQHNAATGVVFAVCVGLILLVARTCATSHSSKPSKPPTPRFNFDEFVKQQRGDLEKRLNSMSEKEREEFYRKILDDERGRWSVPTSPNGKDRGTGK